MSATFCTMLFKVDNVDKIKTETHTHEKYIESLIQLSAYINNIYIWCDQETYNLIHDRLQCTQYHIEIKRIVDLKNYERIVLNSQKMISSEFKKRGVLFYKNTSNILPTLLTIWINKLEIIQSSIQLNKFNTEQYIWIDAGILNRNFLTDNVTDFNILNRPPWCQNAFFISFFNSDEILQKMFDSFDESNLKYLKKILYLYPPYRYLMIATYFQFHSSFFTNFYIEYNRVLEYILSMGMISTEEVIYYLTCKKFKTQIEFGHGAYYNIHNYL